LWRFIIPSRRISSRGRGGRPTRPITVCICLLSPATQRIARERIELRGRKERSITGFRSPC
jgi:hypothetical protein